MTAIVATEGGTPMATAAWHRRVLRIGSLIQTGFAAFWLVRGSLAIDGQIGVPLAAALGGCAAAVLAYGAAATAGKAPRPRDPEAVRLERAITAATVIQLAASFVAPAIVVGAGHPDWVLPSIAVTIGPLLLYLDHLVDLARYRLVGWALVTGPILLAISLDGTAITASTGLAAGALLLVTATAGFHDLAGADRERRTDRAGRVAR